MNALFVYFEINSLTSVHYSGDELSCKLPLISYGDICQMCSRAFFDKRISQEVSGDALGEVWYGYFLVDNGFCQMPRL